MKKYILLAVSMVISIVAMAAPPKLNVEQLFEEPYISDKSVNVMINNTKKEYYRGFTVNNNPQLVKKVTALFKKDAENAEESQDFIDKGEVTFSSMKIINNNREISIGLSYSPGNSCYLFIDGPKEAFK